MAITKLLKPNVIIEKPDVKIEKPSWEDEWKDKSYGAFNRNGTTHFKFFILLPAGNMDYLFRQSELTAERDINEVLYQIIEEARQLCESPMDTPKALPEGAILPPETAGRKAWKEYWTDIIHYTFDTDDMVGFSALLSPESLQYLYEWSTIDRPKAEKSGLSLVLDGPSYYLSTLINRIAERYPDPSVFKEYWRTH